MAKWIAIIILFMMLISYSAVNTLTMFKLQNQVDKLCIGRAVGELQEQVEELYSYKDHFLHRLNALEYPEMVRGKFKEFKKGD